MQDAVVSARADWSDSTDLPDFFILQQSDVGAQTFRV
jgi:hypothetical protein